MRKTEAAKAHIDAVSAKKLLSGESITIRIPKGASSLILTIDKSAQEPHTVWGFLDKFFKD
jgi:hypothetical protein